MKILLVHNNYGKHSGEESVVDKMNLMLTELGHQVVQLRMETVTDSLKGKIIGFISGIHSSVGVRKMHDIISKEKPDIINIHNLYPMISPKALQECKKAGIPVIMTVHNFRLLCPTGLFMREGKACEYCLKKGNEWGCIKYNCEHSLPKSIGYALRNASARLRKDYKDCVDYFACITDFQRKKLNEGGFDRSKLLLIPNSVYVTNESQPSIGDYIGFCGRLSQEKGIDLIIEAARKHSDIPFKLAGECRDASLIYNLPSNIELLGHINGEDLIKFYRNSRFIIMASRCYEGFPMSILEAAQHYKPTIGPEHGGFTEIIGKDEDRIGKLFTPGDVNSLESAIISLWNDSLECQRLGMAAHNKLTKEYSSTVISKKWDSLLNAIVNKTSIPTDLI